MHNEKESNKFKQVLYVTRSFYDLNAKEILIVT